MCLFVSKSLGSSSVCCCDELCHFIFRFLLGRCLVHILSRSDIRRIRLEYSPLFSGIYPSPSCYFFHCTADTKVSSAIICWQTGSRLGAIVCRFPNKHATYHLADLHISPWAANMADLPADPQCGRCCGHSPARSPGAECHQQGKVSGRSRTCPRAGWKHRGSESGIRRAEENDPRLPCTTFNAVGTCWPGKSGRGQGFFIGDEGSPEWADLVDQHPQRRHWCCAKPKRLCWATSRNWYAFSCE